MMKAPIIISIYTKVYRNYKSRPERVQKNFSLHLTLSTKRLKDDKVYPPTGVVCARERCVNVRFGGSFFLSSSFSICFFSVSLTLSVKLGVLSLEAPPCFFFAAEKERLRRCSARVWRLTRECLWSL